MGEAARRGLARIEALEFERDGELERLWAERLDLGAADLGRRRERFLERFGPEGEPHFEALRERVLAAQRAWAEAALGALDQEVDALAGAQRYAPALAAIARVERTAPLGVDVGAALAARRSQVEAAAEVAARALAEEVRGYLGEGRAPFAVARLERALPGYAGLAPYAALKALYAEARAAPGTAPEPGPGPEPGPEPGPGPGMSTPPSPDPPGPDPGPTAPAPAPDALAREALAPLLEERRYAEAADLVAQRAAAEAEGPARAALEAFQGELRDAAAGLAALITHINENPARYGRVELRPRLVVSLAAASAEGLDARVPGGSMRYPWKHVPPAVLAALAGRTGARGEPAFGLAQLLETAGAPDAARAWLYVAGHSGVPAERVFARLARWRGEPVPAEGYVEHEQRYVTVAEREHLLREARIAQALARLGAREAKDRAAALEELLALGEPARARTRAALLERREALAAELAAGKGYAPARHRARLLALLEQRRRHALALIYDAQAYPYPNPDKRNQAEVERRVDEVRQVWERPFELVAQWDAELKAALERLTEADAALARVDAGWRPDLETLARRISAAIDVPAAADGELRAYSLKVLDYNEALATTATEQERDNTRIVNEYRMMMGLQAVKIDERLVRAARGHSRHMRENGYFAHDVPADRGATAENRTPGARAQRQGYGGGVGENIARGPSTGRGAFWAWFGSSGHHRNMLGRGWHEMGCGRSGGSWWTQLFGGGSKSLKPPDPLPAPEPFFAPEPEPAGGARGGPVEVPDEVPPGEPEPPPGDPPGAPGAPEDGPGEE